MSQPSYYCVVRYVPDSIRNESVNIGVVLEAGSNGNRRGLCRFAESLNRAAKLDPSLKQGAVEKIVQGALEQIETEIDSLSLEQLIENYTGGKIQFSRPRVTMTTNFDAELAYLFEQFVIDEMEVRQHGKTEPILKKEVKQVLMKHGINGERVTYASPKNRLVLRGRNASHSFDISIKVNSHEEFVECISFDVEDFNAKLDAAKVLVYDARDIRTANKGVDIFSILYPPKIQSGREPRLAFEEAKTILREEKVEPFNFDSAQDQTRLLQRVA